MRVALIGCPDSGKSELAAKLATHLKDHRIVDDYVERLQEKTNLHLSFGTDYVPNMLVVLERLTRELAEPYDRCITVGTAIETMAYCALFSSYVQETSSPEEAGVDNIRSAIVMNTINFTLDETWRYNHIFYLPNKSNLKMNRELDYAIREVLATLSVDHTPLTEEDQLAQALSVIGDIGEPSSTKK